MIWFVINITFSIVCLFVLIYARRSVNPDSIYIKGSVDVVISSYISRCEQVKLMSRIVMLLFTLICVVEKKWFIPIPSVIVFIISCWFLRYLPKMIIGTEADNPKYIAKSAVGTAGEVAGQVMRITPGGGVKAIAVNGIARHAVRNGVYALSDGIDTGCESLRFAQLIELGNYLSIITEGKSREQLIDEILYILPYAILREYEQYDKEKQVYRIYHDFFKREG